MKYKIGDKIKFLKDWNAHERYGFFKDDLGEIIHENQDVFTVKNIKNKYNIYFYKDITSTFNFNNINSWIKLTGNKKKIG